MEFLKKSAEEIVMEISKIIGQQINLMNEEGIILASTDKDRIGQFHEGALKIINENLDILVIEKDEEFVGVKKGINLPITVEGVTVGVIGITGEREDVEKFGLVIKKMTEILLLKNYYNDRNKRNEKVRKRFIEEWLEGNYKEDLGRFIQRGNFFGIDIQEGKRVIVFQLFENIISNELENQIEIDNINGKIKEFCERRGWIFYRGINFCVGICKKIGNEKLKEDLERFLKELKVSNNIRILVGVDLFESKDVRESFLQGKKVINSLKNKNRNLGFYSQLTLEIIFNEIPIKIQNEFIKNFFGKDFDREELEESLKILEVYYDENGSLRKTSEKLFMHINTLQYKLKKLREITGYDPRNLNEAIYYQLALQFYKEK